MALWSRPYLVNVHVLKETIPSFWVNLLVFTFILLMARFMSLTDLVIGKGVELKAIARVFVLILPKMLSMSIPMAALLATITTFLRLSADSELTVLKASGVSLSQLLPPVLIFGVTAALITGVFNVWLTPLANIQFRTETMALAKARADLAIKEQVFVREFPGLTIYVGHLPLRSESMANIVINDRRSPGENTLVVAQTGLLDIDMARQTLLLRLRNGVIDRMFDNRQSVDSIFFDTYELKISPGPEFDDSEGILSLSRSERPTGELRPLAAKFLKEGRETAYRIYLLEWHRRWSFPVVALLMALIGMPLGASFRAKGRNFGLMIGLIVFVLYYAFFSLGWTVGESGRVPPLFAIWTPTLVMALLVLWLILGLNKVQPIDLSLVFSRWWRQRKRRQAV
ncbi:MAG: LPS export ABC transporter permease LptF [Deltaproteobacteria bacterium]|jgi:lipopolysaccharide export system permease protein|nr:LPS export ABC transporter permease LptF [Deltaproteobacteria bacterium]